MTYLFQPPNEEEYSYYTDDCHYRKHGNNCRLNFGRHDAELVVQPYGKRTRIDLQISIFLEKKMGVAKEGRRYTLLCRRSSANNPDLVDQIRSLFMRGNVASVEGHPRQRSGGGGLM